MSGAKELIKDEDVLCSPLEEVFAKFNSSESGLGTEGVANRIQTYGQNSLGRRKKRFILLRLLSYFGNPLVMLLVIAGFAAYVLGEAVEAIIIFTMVFMSVVLSFLLEYRAEKAAEELKKRVATTATVLRDGVQKQVAISELVPGDIISLSVGDMVPADARLIKTKYFFVEQAALTGESFPAEKAPCLLKKKDVADPTLWTNYVFMGTSVISGTATAVVVKTGLSTHYGEIMKKTLEKRPVTEFDKGLRKFGFLIMQVTFVLVVLVFFTQLFYQRDLLQSMLFAIALAVGLTPELLPMILTVNLSKGAVSMSKNGVIVKRLASIQNFGGMDVLCTDKTGTLTQNRVTLMLHEDLDGKEEEKVFEYSFLNSFNQTGFKSPLDDAILAHKELAELKKIRKVDEIPFDFVRKKVSTVVDLNGGAVIIAKGAPEEIFSVCSFYEKDGTVCEVTPEIDGRMDRRYKELSAEGFRVLGISYKKASEGKKDYSINDESEMVFLGFVAFMDPPKETVAESIRLLKKASIELKVLTGDNELVTKKVCEKIGFEITRIVSGSEMTNLTDDALARVVETANVFVRVTPVQKNRIIIALKNGGHVTGFLGDGINDAPALRTADVGISVENAADVAKDSADIILLQKDLTVLDKGVLEGRKTFGNTTKYILMGISSNFG